MRSAATMASPPSHSPPDETPIPEPTAMTLSDEGFLHRLFLQFGGFRLTPGSHQADRKPTQPKGSQQCLSGPKCGNH